MSATLQEGHLVEKIGVYSSNIFDLGSFQMKKPAQQLRQQSRKTAHLQCQAGCMQFHKQISKPGVQKCCRKLWRNAVDHVWEMQMEEQDRGRRRMTGPTLFVELVSNKFLRLSISSTPGLPRQS